MSGQARAGWLAAAAWPRFADYLQLTKPRLGSLVLVTVAVPYLVASGTTFDLAGLAAVMGGMVLVVGGANSLNQYAERDSDAMMRRTSDRPLPDGRLLPVEALAFGSTTTLAGLAWLLAARGPLVGGLATLAAATYVFAYTPLKRRTPLCTLVGAVPGAIPPLVGWAAAGGQLGWAAWSLFGILFFWQVPHSLAIARRHRVDYARGGYRILAVVDDSGTTTRYVSLAFTVALVVCGALPALLGAAGSIYLIGSGLLGLGLLGLVAASVRRRDDVLERWVFLYSLLYLSALMALLVLDRRPLP